MLVHQRVVLQHLSKAMVPCFVGSSKVRGNMSQRVRSGPLTKGKLIAVPEGGANAHVRNDTWANMAGEWFGS